MCAVDAYYEMKRISQIGEGWDNSVNLPDTLIINEPKLILKMEKFKMTRKSFRVFGSPDTITEENTSDEQVEALLAETPSLSKFFVLRESGEAVKVKSKGGRPSKEQKEAEAKAKAEAEAAESARAEVAALEAAEKAAAEAVEVKEEGEAETTTEQAPEEATSEETTSTEETQS